MVHDRRRWRSGGMRCPPSAHCSFVSKTMAPARRLSPLSSTRTRHLHRVSGIASTTLIYYERLQRLSWPRRPSSPKTPKFNNLCQPHSLHGLRNLNRLSSIHSLRDLCRVGREKARSKQCKSCLPRSSQYPPIFGKAWHTNITSTNLSKS